MNNHKLFLFGSFLSSVGDFTFIFSIPTGLVKETNLANILPFFWLIPAAVMYFALLTKKYFVKRANNIRKDYSYLLFFIGIIEVLYSILLYCFNSLDFILISCVFFIIIYAFFKEGIPRISFNSTVYNLFCHKQHYLKLAAQKGSFDLLGSILGIFISAYLVEANLWRFALIIDAVTFLIFGLIIFLAGKQKPINQSTFDNLFTFNKHALTIKNMENCLLYVLLAIPLVYYVNALYQNYMPIINNELGLLSFSTTILIISIIRSHIIVLSCFIDKLCNKIYWDNVLLGFPMLYVLISLLFLLLPCHFTMLLTIIMSSFFVGIFLPLSLNIINYLNYDVMLEFNTRLGKRIAIFQMTGCVISIIIFHFYGFYKEAIAFSMLIISIFYIFYCLLYKRNFFINSNNTIEDSKKNN
jgi:hypothetical protein